MSVLDLYTGELTYKGIAFFFTFNKDELRLIPPADKRDEVHNTILQQCLYSALLRANFGCPLF